MTNPNNSTLLLVEDNPDDIFLMRRALKKAGLNFPLQVVTDGKEALEYFKGEGKFSDRDQFPPPAWVFLDLKLPYFNGFEVLEWIRQDKTYRNLDVIILTSSAEDRDKHTALMLGAKGYLVKPPTCDSLLQILAQLVDVRPAATLVAVALNA
jgi:CheY-like chemotaxis protein